MTTNASNVKITFCFMVAFVFAYSSNCVWIASYCYYSESIRDRDLNLLQMSLIYFKDFQPFHIKRIRFPFLAVIAPIIFKVQWNNKKSIKKAYIYFIGIYLYSISLLFRGKEKLDELVRLLKTIKKPTAIAHIRHFQIRDIEVGLKHWRLFLSSDHQGTSQNTIFKNELATIILLDQENSNQHLTQIPRPFNQLKCIVFSYHYNYEYFHEIN